MMPAFGLSDSGTTIMVGSLFSETSPDLPMNELPSAWQYQGSR